MPRKQFWEWFRGWYWNRPGRCRQFNRKIGFRWYGQFRQYGRFRLFRWPWWRWFKKPLPPWKLPKRKPLPASRKRSQRIVLHLPQPAHLRLVEVSDEVVAIVGADRPERDEVTGEEVEFEELSNGRPWDLDADRMEVG